MPSRRPTSLRREQALTQTVASEEGLASTSRPDASNYIAGVTGELARIARGSQLPLLAYFLDMARLEAEACARSGSRP